jgi:hypothetical protein
MSNSAAFRADSFDSAAFESYLRASGRAWYKLTTREQAEAIKQYRIEVARKKQADLDLITAVRNQG